MLYFQIKQKKDQSKINDIFWIISKLIFIITLICFNIHNSHAQQAYNAKYDNHLFGSWGRMICETDSFYIGAGHSLLQNNVPESGIYFTKHFKNDGSIHKSMDLTLENESLDVVDNNSPMVLDSQLVYFCLGRINSLYKFTYDFYKDEIDTEILPPLHEYKYNYISASYQKKDSFYLLTLLNQDGKNYKSRLVFIHNNVTKYIDLQLPLDSMFCTGFTLDLHDHMVVALSGFKGNVRKKYLGEFTHTGELVWYAELPASLLITLPEKMIYDKDGFVYVCAWKGMVKNVYPYTFYQQVILKYDLINKKIVGIQNFNNPDFLSLDSPYPVIVDTKDGNILYGGTLSELNEIKQQSIERGVIGKMDRDMKSIWRRTYAIQKHEVENRYYWDELYDVEPTTDGNYICYGESGGYDEELEKEFRESWLFKINEDGYIIDIDSTSSVNDLKAESPIHISPNPVSDVLIINQDDINDVIYNLYDLSGRLIQSHKAPTPYHSFVWQVSDLSPGQYILNATQKGSTIENFKFIKL